jgi:predicted transposase/invertase (TIGR01784 family)
MKKDDLLWKGIIEDMPHYFIRFFFPENHELIDFERGFEFLDKELEELFPIDNPDHPRFVDKLIKAFTLDGTEEWILIHIEVQGQTDHDFGKRMYTYFYRLLDRYQKPVTALAIFTDDKPGYKPDHYHYEFMGTSQTYRFNTYKILEQQEESLAVHPNPFALVVLTVLVAIKNRKAGDERLMQLKIDLFRRMLARNMDKTTMRALANFLKMYVHFSKPDTALIFETEIKAITNNITTMGIEELILHRAEQKGIEKGKAEGKAEVVRNLITKLGLNDAQAADVAEVPVAFVQQVRASLKGN